MKGVPFARTLVAVWVSGVCVMAGADEPSLAEAVTAAARSYDVTAATVALARVRDGRSGNPESGLTRLQVRASLVLAELLRIEWEELPADDPARRRELGKRIDAVAREGLTVAGGLPESSETERTRADLLATMMRSDFRAKKYEAEFKAAVDRALQLDERNARAWVSRSKTFLFAAREHGGDLTEAVRLLDHALALDPRLESALLLRAVGHERLGNIEEAISDLEVALAHNSQCLPASRALSRLAAH